MKRVIAILLTFVMAIGLFSCDVPIDLADSSSTSTTEKGTVIIGGNSTTTTVNGGNNTTDPTVNTPDIPKEDPDLGGFDVEELELFYEFFDHENHVSLDLQISDSELKKIQKDYEKYSSMGSKSPIYRMADLRVTITKPNGEKLEYFIEQVGVRMKGNTSRTSFWDSNSGMYNLVHFKISFQETFDDAEYYGSDALVWNDTDARKERKDRTFATLEKIDMRWNKNDDPTYIREIYAYDMYRSYGVLAPHTNLASVDIGNDHAGVWVFYEPIDKIFLEKNLSPEALGGDLYKLGWTNEPASFTSFSSYGVEDEDACKFYVYDLKTNKKTSTHASLKNLINTLNSSTCTKQSFESVVDVDNFLLYAAISYMIGNPDDLRNNYNNTYVYFRADTGKAIFIPYDMDRGLGCNKDWNPSGDHLTTESPFQSRVVSGEQRNPIFKKSIQNGGFFKNEYVEVLKMVGMSEMLEPSYFEGCFNVAKNLYDDETTPSKRYGNAWDHNFSFDINKTCDLGHSSNLSFKEYTNAKRQTLAKYIDGYSPDIDNSGSGSDNNSGDNTTVSDWDLYLRGNFDDNNWENYGNYKLKHIGDGVYSITVTATRSSGDAGTFKFKIYNQKQNGDEAWYNTVDESKINTSFEYQGSNRNVQVALGTYVIYFDTNTQTIYFEKQ